MFVSFSDYMNFNWAQIEIVQKLSDFWLVFVTLTSSSPYSCVETFAFPRCGPTPEWRGKLTISHISHLINPQPQSAGPLEVGGRVEGGWCSPQILVRIGAKHSTSLQYLTGKYRGLQGNVMKTGTLQWEQGFPVMKTGVSLWELTYRELPDFLTFLRPWVSSKEKT